MRQNQKENPDNFNVDPLDAFEGDTDLYMNIMIKTP
jgi:hypothetical protein